MKLALKVHGAILAVCLILVVSIGIQNLHQQNVERDMEIHRLMTNDPVTQQYALRILYADSDHKLDRVMRDFYVNFIGVPEVEYRWKRSNRAEMIEYISEGNCTWSVYAQEIRLTKNSDYYLRTGRQ